MTSQAVCLIGVKQTAPEHIHDDIAITLNMLITDPKNVQWEQRVKAGKATINGFSIADQKEALELARKVVEFRATKTVDAIKKSLAAKPRPGNQQECETSGMRGVSNIQFA